MKRSGTLAQRIIGIIFTALGLIFVLIGLGLFAHEQYFNMSLLFVGLGTPFVLIGCGFLIYCVVVRKRIQRLVKEGRKIEATITGYRVNRNVRVNGRCPIQLQCEYQDLLTEQKVLYQSGNCWEEPQHLQNQQVTIYVDYNYPNKYYVDLDSIQQERDMQELDYR